jgi:hypothetical protein
VPYETSRGYSTVTASQLRVAPASGSFPAQSIHRVSLASFHTLDRQHPSSAITRESYEQLFRELRLRELWELDFDIYQAQYRRAYVQGAEYSPYLAAGKEEQEVFELVSALSRFLGLDPTGRLEDIQCPVQTFTQLRQRFMPNDNIASSSFEALLASLPRHPLLQVSEVRQIILHLPVPFVQQLQVTTVENVPHVLFHQLRARILSTDGSHALPAPIRLGSTTTFHEFATAAPSLSEAHSGARTVGYPPSLGQ